MTFSSFRRPATPATTPKLIDTMGPPPPRLVEKNMPLSVGGKLGHAAFSASGPHALTGPAHIDPDALCETIFHQKRALPSPRNGPPSKRTTTFPPFGRTVAEDPLGPLPTSLSNKIAEHLTQKKTEFHGRLASLQTKHDKVSHELEHFRSLIDDLRWESEYPGGDKGVSSGMSSWKLEKKVNCLALRQHKLAKKIQLITAPETEALLSTQLTIYHQLYEQENTKTLRHEIMNDFAGRFGTAEVPVSHYNIMECQRCHTAMHVTTQTGFLQCAQCLQTIPYNEWLPYSASGGTVAADDVDVCSYASKKLAGFQEFLLCVQGKKLVPTLEAEIPNLRKYLVSKGCPTRISGVPPAEGGIVVSSQNIFEMLTHLNKRKFLKYSSLLEYRLKELPPLQLTLQQESRFKAMLSSLIEPYLKHKPPERCHFLSYAYCGWQFCRIEGLTHLYGLFRLLKDPAKVKVQDQTFQSICMETGWPYASPRDFPEFFASNSL